MKIICSILIFLVLPLSNLCQELNDGEIVKSNASPEVYLVMNRHLHHIPDPSVFKNLFLSSVKIKIVSPVSLELLPKGVPLKNGRLIKASNMAVFVQCDKYKTHIPNPETFNFYSFDWSKIINVSDEEIIDYITLLPISSIIEKEKYIEPNPCGTRD